MKLIIIAAINKKRVIGANGKIPWHIPEDVKRFKELTMGHAVLMGRKTYDSIGKPLPGRRNVVITSRNLPEVEHYPSVDRALAAVATEEQVFVIGGGELYRQTIDKADELDLTIVENEATGDIYFPERDIRSMFSFESSEKHDGFEFRRYKKL
ncbi:MAG: dihydrofolate reductase [Bacteroidota bacterium]